MKKVIFSLVMVVCYASPVVAVDLTGRGGINGNVGVLFPVGDLSDVADTSFVLGEKLLYGFRSNLIAEVNVSYSPLSEDEDLEILGIDADLSVLELTGGVRYLLAPYGRMIPYVSGGLGIYISSSNVNVSPAGFSPTESNTEADVGLHVGGGFMYFLSDSMAFDMQGRLHVSNPDYFAITGGLSFFFR